MRAILLLAVLLAAEAYRGGDSCSRACLRQRSLLQDVPLGSAAAPAAGGGAASPEAPPPPPDPRPEPAPPAPPPPGGAALTVASVGGANASAELAAALMNPSVTLITVDAGNLIMRPSQFPSYGLGRPKGLLVIDRDVTIRGEDVDNLTTIDWNMLDATMLLKAGRSMTFQDMAVANIRYGPSTGADFLRGEGPASLLRFHNVLWKRKVCLPLTSTGNVGLVGAIYSTMGASVIDDGSPEATLLRLPSYCSNGTCYQGNIVYVRHGFVLVTPQSDDLAITQQGVAQTDSRYMWELTNVTRVCSRTVSEDCLETASANACYDVAYVAYHRELATNGHGAAAAKQRRTVSVAVPLALGGTVLAAAAIAAPLAARARRRRAAAAAMTAAAASTVGKASSQESHEYQQAWAALGNPRGGGGPGDSWRLMARNTAPQFDNAEHLIDHVQLGVLIGAGSFGRVYKGRWQGRDVAVKVMVHDAAVAKSVAREIDLVMSFSHPNIVQAFHFVSWRKHSSGTTAAQQQHQAAADGSSGHSSELGFLPGAGDIYTPAQPGAPAGPAAPSSGSGPASTGGTAATAGGEAGATASAGRVAPTTPERPAAPPLTIRGIDVTDPSGSVRSGAAAGGTRGAAAGGSSSGGGSGGGGGSGSGQAPAPGLVSPKGADGRAPQLPRPALAAPAAGRQHEPRRRGGSHQGDATTNAGLIERAAAAAGQQSQPPSSNPSSSTGAADAALASAVAQQGQTPSSATTGGGAAPRSDTSGAIASSGTATGSSHLYGQQPPFSPAAAGAGSGTGPALMGLGASPSSVTAGGGGGGGGGAAGGGVGGGGGRARKSAPCGARSEAQTWLVLEYCDQGNLSDAVHAGMLHTRPVLPTEEEGTGSGSGGSSSSSSSGEPTPRGGRARRDNRGFPFESLDLPRALALLLDVARGMAYLHARNVVHADLKCQNVLLAAVPAAFWGQTAKISDFGLSKALALDQTHVTTHSMGTITHMPPEMFKTGRMSPAGDVYAFGVMVWEVITGRGAFHGLHYAEVIEQVAIRGARPPVPEAAPPELRALMEACWQADPTKRPGFDALVTCLELLLAACGVRPDGSGTGSSAPAAGSGSHSGGVRSTSGGSGRGPSRLSDGGAPSDGGRRATGSTGGGGTGGTGGASLLPSSSLSSAPLSAGPAVPLSTLDAAVAPLPAPSLRHGPQSQAGAWGAAAREQQAQAASRPPGALPFPPRQQRLHPVGSIPAPGSQLPGSGSIGTLGPTSGGPTGSSGLPSLGAPAAPPGRRPSPAKPMESSSFVHDL
ncbi:hypothetical protein Rsub_00114 [Raphidocelis subcapitata]|uniref:Protein kinase domain-containing protein n=1 Tax=Raphidocelis subcapitata TaxID=307507 RepID=A0A2V0NPF9_9CHLO|nr:hypothetical protein Rsub_00114 [Raphidocelis subcapitata]|eukprot:GBF87403.1 hypothetical protein Rsub_00114 [Raphidocelis subcapitata]